MKPRDSRVRYRIHWRNNYLAHVRPLLFPGISILDVGSGIHPAIPIEERPHGTEYVGLDIESEELKRAPAGSYTEEVVSDICSFRPEFVDHFDLVLSWQVLEHVEDLSAALANMRRYLKPNGNMISLLSGRYAVFALLNRMLPENVGKEAMRRLLRRSPDSVFRAHYNRCDSKNLEVIGRRWDSFSIEPYFRGADYFDFSRFLEGVYLAVEDQMVAHRFVRFATHYLVIGKR